MPNREREKESKESFSSKYFPKLPGRHQSPCHHHIFAFFLKILPTIVVLLQSLVLTLAQTARAVQAKPSTGSLGLGKGL